MNNREFQVDIVYGKFESIYVSYNRHILVLLVQYTKEKEVVDTEFAKKKVLENDDEVWKSPGKVLKFDVDQRVDTM